MFLMCKISMSQSPLTQRLNDQVKVRDERWRTKLKSNYILRNIEFKDLHRVVKSDYRTYSAGEFVNNYAKNENWIGQELLILDVDDGLSLEEAKKIFKKYKAMIHTSTSHQKDKGGVKCDRFRVIVELKTGLDCTVKDYTNTMKMLSDNMFPFIDKKCVDPARIYFGYAGAEIHYTGGEELFDFYKYLSLSHRLQEASAKIPVQPKMVNNTYTEGEDVITKFNTDHTIDEMLSRNGYKQQGNRWVSPTSSTGMAGVIIMDGDDGIQRAYSHHSSDEWELETAFGIYAILEHGGDMQRATQSLKIGAVG